MNISSSAASLFVDPENDTRMTVTSWGEAARGRISAAQTQNRLAVLDYRAISGFGPGRHVHWRDDEIFLVQQGEIVLWSPERCGTAGPGDVVLLPRAVPHTWRSHGGDPVRLQVIVAPGEFETFFEDLVDRKLTLDDEVEMAAVARSVGVDFLGPPLSNADVAAILRGEHV